MKRGLASVMYRPSAKKRRGDCTVHQGSEHFLRLENLKAFLKLMFFCDSLTGDKKNAIREPHPDAGIRQRKNRRRINNDPIEDLGEPIHELWQLLRLQNFERIARCAAGGQDPDSGLFKMVDILEQVVVFLQRITEAGDLLLPRTWSARQEGVRHLRSTTLFLRRHARVRTRDSPDHAPFSIAVLEASSSAAVDPVSANDFRVLPNASLCVHPRALSAARFHWLMRPF